MFENGLKIHSPVEQLFDPLFVDKKVEVFVKRDDLIHPFISGNKWRKLKYLLTDAAEKRRHHLITFGGAYSNHLLATACAAAKFGFESTGFVRGERVENEVLMLCQLFGMKLIFTERSAYRNKIELFKQNFEKDSRAYFIDEGGAGELGVKGCAELIEELPISYDHLFCAAGTGTTAAGIIRGVEVNQLNSLVHIVPVLKGGEFLRQEILGYSARPFEFHSDFHFGGYAKINEELIKFIKTFCASTGLLIEPVYTGKMFFALYELIRQGNFSAGSKILAIHSGGLTGILGMKEQFGAER